MSILESDPRIYKKMIYPAKGYLGRLIKEDYGGMFGFLQDHGYTLDPTDGRWRRVGAYRSIVQSTPWCHAKGSIHKHCNLDHNIIFNQFDIIPPRCLQCWKVVVTPTTFDQLIKLEQLQISMGFPSKCGIEMRDYTPKFYGGYFYNHSLDEGREKLEIVQKAVAEHISKEIADEVILKRGCTEFEMLKGPSPYWHMTDEQQEQYDIIEALVDVPRGNTGQDEMQKRMVRIKWFLWAHMNNDMTYKEYNDGESLFPDYVKYNDGDIDDLKRDLVMASAYAKYGTPIEISSEFLEMAQKFAGKHKMVSLGKLGASLGFEQTNNFRLNQIHLSDVVPEAKGDHDELT